MDAAGNLYFSAYEQMAIVQRTPDGTYKTLARAPMLGWSDGMFYTGDGWLYVAHAP